MSLTLIVRWYDVRLRDQSRIGSVNSQAIEIAYTRMVHPAKAWPLPRASIISIQDRRNAGGITRSVPVREIIAAVCSRLALPSLSRGALYG